MKKILAFFSTSVGRKLLMGLSGLFLCSFLVVHLYINLFVLKSDTGQTFDVYAEFMSTYPLMRPLEIVLFAGFLLHMILGIWLWYANRKVRPQGYAVNRASDTSALSSRIMWITGGFVLVFLVLHVNAFFVRSRFFPHDQTMYDIIRDAFQSPTTVVFYLVALVFLAYHLRHGWQSSFQTFGLLNGKYKGLIEAVGVVFWLLIPAGFALIPIVVFLSH
ncbi:MAG: succinate dehydrogenase subunit [candidate division NC10 bacterium]|nr:succinate dehydrogenase subunit [candidate division NC10 bacterium]